MKDEETNMRCETAELNDYVLFIKLESIAKMYSNLSSTLFKSLVLT